MSRFTNIAKWMASMRAKGAQHPTLTHLYNYQVYTLTIHASAWRLTPSQSTSWNFEAYPAIGRVEELRETATVLRRLWVAYRWRWKDNHYHFPLLNASETTPISPFAAWLRPLPRELVRLSLLRFLISIILADWNIVCHYSNLVGRKIQHRYHTNSATQELDNSHVDKVCISQFLKRFNLLH